MGEWMYSSTIIDLGTRWRWVVSFMPRPLYPDEKAPVTHWIGGWITPELVWTLLSGEKYLALARSRTPAAQHVAHHYIDWAIRESIIPKLYLGYYISN
jgi:hypothetical protein